MAVIYLIEDDQQLREYTALLLSLHDYVVKSFEGGAEMLAACATELPDLVLCDVKLPGLTGFQVLDQFRHWPLARHIPFIFVSAHAEREQIRKGMNLGADDYLTKPFTERELIDMVRTRLSIHARRRETLESHFAEMNARALRCLSHEIRTPLNGVMGGLELMQMDRPGTAPEELGIVATSAVRLERTLLRYLAFMEASSDALPLRSQELAPVEMLIEDVASRIAESCDRGADLVLHVDCQLRTLHGRELTQVLEEIVGNAFKFSDRGSDVHVIATTSHQTLSIEVRDDGVGMTDEEVAAIGPSAASPPTTATTWPWASGSLSRKNSSPKCRESSLFPAAVRAEWWHASSCPPIPWGFRHEIRFRSAGRGPGHVSRPPPVHAQDHPRHRPSLRRLHDRRGPRLLRPQRLRPHHLRLQAPDGSAHDLIGDVHRLKPEQEFIILTALPVPEGGQGRGTSRVYWIDKNNTFHSLKGRIDSLFGQRLRGDDLPASRLTTREREVLQLIGGGFTSKEIAAASLFPSRPSRPTANPSPKSSACPAPSS